jgi:hypothetical protein
VYASVSEKRSVESICMGVQVTKEDVAEAQRLLFLSKAMSPAQLGVVRVVTATITTLTRRDMVLCTY